jgi:hypothetical protein
MNGTFEKWEEKNEVATTSLACQIWHVKFDAKGYVQQYLRSANHNDLL